MMINLLNKILVISFVLSCLVTLRHMYYLFQTLSMSTEEKPMKYKVNGLSLFFLGLSLAYIISSLFIGIKI